MLSGAHRAATWRSLAQTRQITPKMRALARNCRIIYHNDIAFNDDDDDIAIRSIKVQLNSISRANNEIACQLT